MNMLQQPKSLTSSVKKTRSKSKSSGEESDNGNEGDDAAIKDIPEAVRFDPNSLERKPKGLVDSLSKYFTPGVKRTSRTALSSLLKPQGGNSIDKISA